VVGLVWNVQREGGCAGRLEMCGRSFVWMGRFCATSLRGCEVQVLRRHCID